MAFFDDKVRDYFANYGKPTPLLKSCKCKATISEVWMPNIVLRCMECDTTIHPCYVRG